MKIKSKVLCLKNAHVSTCITTANVTTSVLDDAKPHTFDFFHYYNIHVKNERHTVEQADKKLISPLTGIIIVLYVAATRGGGQRH